MSTHSPDGRRDREYDPVLPPTYFRIQHPRGEDTHLQVIEATLIESFDEQAHLEATVYRDDLQRARRNRDFLPRDDEWYFVVGETEWFGGRLAEIDRGGTTVSLSIGSFETDAREAAPTSGARRYVNASDGDVVRDAIAIMDGVEPGRISTPGETISFLFPYTSPAKILRTVRDATGVEIQYNPDQTVDVVERLGRDYNIELGPHNQNLTTELNIVEDAFDAPTHLLALGAGEGDHQIEAVSESVTYDPATSRAVWKTVANKDIVDEDHLAAWAEQLMAEYDYAPEYIELGATLDGDIVPVGLGDTFPVLSRPEQIETRLRVIELETTLAEDGVTYDVVLSNRVFTREGADQKDRQDIQRYNQGFEGNAVPVSQSGGRQPVDAENNYEMDLWYPSDVKRELRAELLINGLPYRAYSSGAAASGGSLVEETSASNDNFENVVELERVQTRIRDLTNDWRRVSAFETDANTSIVFCPVSMMQTPLANHDNPDARLQGSTGRAYRMRLWNKTNDTYHPSREGDTVYMYGDDSASALFLEARDISGEELELQVQHSGSVGPHPIITAYVSWLGVGQHTHSLEFELPEHTHDPDPGIIEFDHYPEDCDVLINGEAVGVSVGQGGGSFSETVDIANYLDDGFNTIEITSETLGHISASASLDLYRQILGGDSDGGGIGAQHTGSAIQPGGSPQSAPPRTMADRLNSGEFDG